MVRANKVGMLREAMMLSPGKPFRLLPLAQQGTGDTEKVKSWKAQGQGGLCSLLALV